MSKKGIVTIVLGNGAEIDLASPVKVLAFRGYTPIPIEVPTKTITVATPNLTKKEKIDEKA